MSASHDVLAPGLYLVATPIGNLGDVTARAADWLRRADIIACEDTRVTATLLRHIGSERPTRRHDDHADDRARDALVAQMATQSVALVSDAGTPLISDPGWRLVRAARAAGVPVTAAPGPCAAVMALTLSGLPSDRFLFAGFLPAKARARDEALAALAAVPATLIFYETGPRLHDSLEAAARILGPREAAVARELTKRFETLEAAPLPELAARFETPPRGEIVLLIGPPGERAPDADALDEALMRALETMPPGRAAASVSAALGLPRSAVYARALELKP
jgi:16S rRNA (cytidine1402-2'-O)-methyltransferase